MDQKIFTLFVLAASVMAAANARDRHSVYSGSSQSSQYGSGGAGTGGASASASSFAGSSAGDSGSYSGSSSGGAPGSYSQAGGYNQGGPVKGQGYPSGSGGYQKNGIPPSNGGYDGGYNGGYNGGQAPGFTPGQNLPPGCLSGFPGAAGPNFGADWDPYRIQQAIFNQIQETRRIHEENLRFGAELASKAGQGGPGTQSAFASGHIGPKGGYGSASVSPPGQDSIATRFGEPSQGPVHSISGNIAPPAGTVYGVSTSSVSHTDVGPDGVPKTYKESSVSVNDNGKVTTYKAHNP